MPIVLDGTTGITAPDVDSKVNGLNYPDASSMGFRNRIINGDMRIDQRNAGASVGSASGSSAFLVDRWLFAYTQTSKMTGQQNAGLVTPPVGFTNYLGITSSSAYSVLTGDTFGLFHRIEGLNVSDLGWGSANAQAITLSFWVRSSLTGTFGGALQNSAADRSYPFSYTISSANTWEQKSITVAGDTSGTWLTTNGIGIQLVVGLGSGATWSGTAGAWAAANLRTATGAVSVVGTNGATFYITGVQLEAGSVATPFERRPYGTELALCQRYYEKSYDPATVPGTATGTGYSLGWMNSSPTTYYSGTIDKFAVAKRASPTMRFWDIAGNLTRTSTYTGGGLVRQDNNNNTFSYVGSVSSAAMLVVPAVGTFAAWQWEASAEL